jgi:hypothetical protein
MKKLIKSISLVFVAAFSMSAGAQSYSHCTMRNCKGDDCKSAQAAYNSCIASANAAASNKRMGSDPNSNSRPNNANQNRSPVNLNSNTNPR